ncbi:MAG: hypothetical protein HYT03_02650 [Candidatus Harrisonbacteria bacterium]|nr:hypothetical protein [Candidatus Harrisonbacteria bacterium]
MNLELLAFIGTILVAIAYIPQIVHLITKHCAYGISVKAWLLWFFATLLILPHAIAVGDRVLIFLISAHIIAISFIVIFSYFHQAKVCDEHKHKFL